MSNHRVVHPRNGFVLLEALIALLILAVGLLALGQFQGRLMQASGESKMVSEAIHFAQREIDRLRSLEWADLISSANPVEREGTNANFLVEWDVTTDPNGIKIIEVRVLLDDDSDRLVTAMNTWIAEGSDVVLAFEQTGGDLVLFDEDNPLEWVDEKPEPRSVDDLVIGDIDRDGKTFIAVAQPGDSGTALLIEGSTSSGTGNGFARIGGNVFVASPADFDPTNYQVSITGAGVCTAFPSTLPDDLDQTRIVGSNYRLMGYSCYVPAGWQGFIRLRATDPDGICVGSFGTVDADSRIVDGPLPEGAFGQIDRTYLGFDEDGLIGGAGIAGSPLPGGAEIGSVCLLGTSCDGEDRSSLAPNLARNLVPGGHHFLVTSFSGSDPLATQCRDAMIALAETDYVLSTNNRSNPFWDNPSNFVCLAGECAAATGTATRFRTRFGGFFTNPDSLNVNPEILGLLGGFSCQPFGPFGTDAGTYWCAVNKVASGELTPTYVDRAFDADPDSTLSEPSTPVRSKYYYSTDPINLAGITSSPLDIEKRVHFTNMNFRIRTGSSVGENGNGGGNGTGECSISISGTSKTTGTGGNRRPVPVSYSTDGGNPVACATRNNGSNGFYDCGPFVSAPNTPFSVTHDGDVQSRNTGSCALGGETSFVIDFR